MLNEKHGCLFSEKNVNNTHTSHRQNRALPSLSCLKPILHQKVGKKGQVWTNVCFIEEIAYQTVVRFHNYAYKSHD